MGMVMFALMACSNSSGDTGGTPDIPLTPNPKPTDTEAQVFTTTADGVYALTQTTANVSTGDNMAPTTLQVDPTKRYQTIDGFGFAITYSTCYNLLKMSAADREALLKRTYSPTEGYGVSYARISIGCNDFSSREYTLCDKEGLDNFALQSDETSYVMPVLKEILSINPNLKIIAAPWTCPRWMKVKDIKSLKPHNEWTDGHVNPNMYDTYAQYFVKFVKAMEQNGINIYAVSPQNEPLNKQNCASTYMPWQEEAELVRSMAKAFKANGLTTQIYVYDHNYDYSNISDQKSYPLKIYNALGKTFEGSELVVGAAYHDYGGSNTELTNVFNGAPDKSLIFSESSIGEWNDGRNLKTRLMADMKNVALGTVNKNCKAVMVWNLMLDKKKGPNLDGGCQTCYGAVDINQDNYKDLSYNSHYFIISHMAAAAEPGAVRIGVKSAPVSSTLTTSQFVNPDGSYGVVLINDGDTDIKLTVSDGNKHFPVTVPAKGVVSARWK